jgi:hypothetical protein
MAAAMTQGVKKNSVWNGDLGDDFVCWAGKVGETVKFYLRQAISLDYIGFTVDEFKAIFLRKSHKKALKFRGTIYRMLGECRSPRFETTHSFQMRVRALK